MSGIEEVLEYIRSHHFGLYRGIVTAVEGDTVHRGRIKVKVPAVTGDLELWATPSAPFAGPDVGFHALPPKDAGVWIQYEAGDPSFPVWTGGFWANDQLPDDVDHHIKVIRTAAATIRIDDEAKEVRITITDGAELRLDGSELVATMGDGSVTIDGSVALAAGSSSVVNVSTSGTDVNNGKLSVSVT